MLYLSLADTERLDLRMAEVVPFIEEAFRLAGQGKAIVAPRTRLVHPPLPEGSAGQGRPWVRDLRIIPGGLEGIGFGVRLGGSVRHQGGGVGLALFDWQTMAFKALISDHLVHAVRSTAPDGVLAKYLALPDASVLGLIGSGRLARWAAEAVCATRPIRDVRVWSPNPEHVQACVAHLQSRADAGVHVSAGATAQAVVEEAHIVATATTAFEPVLNGDWLAPGCTVISNRPEELDRATIRRGRVVTTYGEGVLGHVPPFEALEEVGADFTELADIVAGRKPGRTSPEEIIVAINPAYGVLDAATAEFVYRKAIVAGVGVELQP
jgi:alanine dehydrogenase